MKNHCHSCERHDNLKKCKHCNEYFCEEHLPAKMCLTPSVLNNKKTPVWIRTELEKEWRKEGGHPDAEYTTKRWKGFNRKEELHDKSLIGLLNTPKQEHLRMPQMLPSEEPIGKPYEPPFPRQKIHFKFPSNNFKFLFKNYIFWYISYLFLIIFLAYASSYWKDFYIFSITYFKYVFYGISAFLGVFIPYKLFKKIEYKEPKSDLQLWLWRVVSGILTFISFVFIMFSSLFLTVSELVTIGKEIGFGISIFFGFLFIGILLFSLYLLFKYKIRSGIMIHRGIW